jgi:hypothetical protein
MKNILVAALVAAFAAVCANAQGPPPGASSSTAGGSGTGLPAGPTSPNSRAQLCTETPSGGVAPSNCTWGLAGDFPPDRPSGESSYTFAATDIGTSVRETNPAGETFTIPDGNTAGFVPPVNIGIIVRGGASTLQRQTSSQVACTPNGALANSCALAAGAQYILKETSDFNYTLSATGDVATAIQNTSTAPSGSGQIAINSANGGLRWWNGASALYAASVGTVAIVTCTNQFIYDIRFNAAPLCGTIPAAALPNGIWDFNQAAQSQVVVSGTEYYITNSNLNMPATYLTPIAAGTTLKWHVTMTKTAAGTGTFQILFKDGTNGTTADTTDATVTIGTQTAVVDDLDFDLVITFTSTTAYYYSLAPHQAGPSGAGFGLVYPATAAQFSGTVTGLTTTTASNKYGLSFKATTGTPTIVVNQVQAEALGVN